MFPTAMTFGPDGALYVSNYGNESNDGQGQVVRVMIGRQVAEAPAVPAPDESRSYALAQPTPIGQASGEVAGEVSIVEPADAMQWGFEPKTLTVQAGQALRFTNSGKIAHTATQSQGAFDTGFLKAGESATLRFDTPGTFAFFCQPHPWMQGTIVVEGDARGAAAAGGAPVASLPEENAQPPTIGVFRAAALVVGIIGLVFAMGYASARSKRRSGTRE
jgi:plastocyanin